MMTVLENASFFLLQIEKNQTKENSSGEMSELAEGARLEIACAANSGTEGSNPSLSAMITS